MSSSIPSSSSLEIRDIEFRDRSRLYSATDFNNDIRFRKKFRVDNDVLFKRDLEVDGNIIVHGSITGDEGETPTQYVDRQTGWGLDEWSFAGATYDKETDSLIIKIANIEINYATVAYVDSKVQNANGRYLVPHEPNTVTKIASPSETYPYACTTLAANTSLFIRDGTNFTNDFKFQKGTITIGHVLKCIDTEGTVGWRSEATTSYVAETIITSYGVTDSQYSFKVADGASGNGVFVFPRVASDAANKALVAHSAALLFGNGDYPTLQTRFVVGPMSFGDEAISFIPSTSSSSQNGSTIITGGSSLHDQQITLNTNGIYVTPKPNKGINFVLPYVTKNLNLNQWTKPFSIIGIDQQNSEYPTLIVTKENSSNHKRSFMINPRMNGGNFNPLVRAGDIGLVFADTTSFDADGGATTLPEQDVILTLTPWSNYCDGFQIRTSLTSQENENNVNYSGYTRLCGASSVVVNGDGTRNPAHYLEVNRQGVTFVNSASSSTINYGKMKILSKVGAILNNPLTSSQVGQLDVGELTRPCDSFFYGAISSWSDLYFKKGAALNKVLTCTNASTGETKWVSIPQASVPANLVVTTLECDAVLTKDIGVVDMLQTFDYDLEGSTIEWVTETFTELQIYADEIATVPLPIDSTNQAYLTRSTYYTLRSSEFIPICNITVPPGDISLYKMTCPLFLNHTWNFLNNRQESNERCNFWYEFHGVEYEIWAGSNLIFEGSTFNTRAEQIVAVGYDRNPTYPLHVGKDGPNGTYNKLNHDLFLEQLILNFAFQKETTTKIYTVKISPRLNFFYKGEYITNYFVNPTTLAPTVWIPFKIVTNRHILITQNNRLYSKEIFVNEVDVTSTYPTNFDEIKWDSVTGYYEYYSGSGFKGRPFFIWGAHAYEVDTSTLSPQHVASFPREKALITSEIFTNRLLVYSDLFISNGYLTSQGIHCRKGAGTQENYDINSSQSNKSGSLYWRRDRFVFNMHWSDSPQDAGLKIYINENVVQEFTPNTCDYRLKSNLREAPSVLKRIGDEVQFYEFDRIENGVLPATQKHIGVIAHEIQEVFPDIPHLVLHQKDETEFQAINHQEMIMLLLKAVQELKHETEELKREIHSLKWSFSLST